MGFEYWRDRINTFYTGNSGAFGAIIFNGAFTSSDPTNVTPATGGYGGADFYLGLPSSYGKGISGWTVGPAGQHFCRVYPGRLESHQQPHYQPWTALRGSHSLGRDARPASQFRSVHRQVLAPNCAKVDLGTAPVTCRQQQAVASTTALTAPRTSSLASALPGRRAIWVARRYSAAPSASRPIWKARARTFASPSTHPSPPAETLVQYNNVALPATTTG